MPEQNQPVRVDQIDWSTALPFVHLFRSFRIAIQPPVLLLSLVLVVVLFLFGGLLEKFFGGRVYPGELDAYSRKIPSEFQVWVNDRERELLGVLDARMDFLSRDKKPNYLKQKANRLKALVADLPGAGPGLDRMVDAALEDVNAYYRARGDVEPEGAGAVRRREIRAMHKLGIFEATLRFKIKRFKNLVFAATRLRFGLDELVGGGAHDSQTVIGALRDLILVLPCWLFHGHWQFMTLWGLGSLVFLALLGGAICRMTALHATRDERISASAALGFARRKWVWFFFAPIIPLILICLIGLVMGVGGLLFNWWVTDIIGALFFFMWLFGGLVVALLLIGLAGGINLLYPAIAVEGTEAFDAISRAFHYVFFRSWSLVFYNLVAWMYGAITYLFVVGVIFLALTVTQWFAGIWVLEALGGHDTFDAIMPPPQIEKLGYEVDWWALGPTMKIAAALIYMWVFLLTATLAAYAISYYFSANTWIYLLLRRVADGVAFDDVWDDDTGTESEGSGELVAPDKVEPTDTQPFGEEPGGSDKESAGS